MIKASIEITYVTKYEREDMDHNMQQYAECEFRELGNIDANLQNRGNFRLRGTEAEQVQKGDQGEVEVRLNRQAVQKRDGGSFIKTEVSFTNWKCIRPAAF